MLKTVGNPSTRYGDQTIIDGNLVIGTAGKGIDFSATSGTGTSELLDDYEEGTFTPTFTNLTLGDGTAQGRYTKVGRIVTVEVFVLWGSTTSASGSWSVNNLPFVSDATHFAYGSGNILDAGVANYWSGTVVPAATSNMFFLAINASGTYLTQSNTSATLPMTWVATDSVRASLTYTAV
jgi:hypothetical protein